MELENARVCWFLSLDIDDLPEKVQKENKTTYRSITVDGDEIEFSGGFTDLHTVTYENILDGNSYGIEDVRPVINLLYDIRNAKPTGVHLEHSHSFLKDE